jgi:hypothetical protein
MHIISPILFSVLKTVVNEDSNYFPGDGPRDWMCAMQFLSWIWDTHMKLYRYSQIHLIWHPWEWASAGLPNIPGY